MRFVLQGVFVVLAAESLCICGIDVAAPLQARLTTGHSIKDLRNNFEKQCTSKEVRGCMLLLQLTTHMLLWHHFMHLHAPACTIIMSHPLHVMQWLAMEQAGDHTLQVLAFQKHWSLKEVSAYHVTAQVALHS